MEIRTPAQAAAACSESGPARVRQPLSSMAVKAVLAGMIIAFGGAVTNTAAFSLSSVSAVRMACGLLFPFGLTMILFTGGELFTGNTLLLVPLLERRVRVGEVLHNLVLVYLFNALGGFLVAAGCAASGQMEYGEGALAVFTIRLAASKCAISPMGALVMGIFCNLLVCLGIVLSLCARDPVGKFIGAYLPVSFFVICGFEHCVANMYYIPAGLLALANPHYAALAAEAGVAVQQLTWGNYLLANMLPVTVGNIVGGALVGLFLWFCYLRDRTPAKA